MSVWGCVVITAHSLIRLIMALCLFSTRSCFTLNERPKLKEMTAEAQGLLSRPCPAVGGAREELLICSPYGQLL